jgi:hypothetical protein
MALYKTVLKGTFQGQAIDNILYYRNGVGVDLSGLTLGGTKELSDAVRAMVWPALRPIMSPAYTLVEVDTYVYNDQTFDLLYQTPYAEVINEVGTHPTTFGLNGPAPCAILKFVLESHPILVDGPKPPKRGYLAIGPLDDGQISNDGSLNLASPEGGLWTSLCNAVSENVETILPIPAVFFPVRVHMDRVGIGLKLKITSFTDIQGALMRHFTSYRRSRMPEN